MRISGPYDVDNLKSKIAASEKSQLLEGVQDSAAELDPKAVTRIRKVEKQEATESAVVLTDNASKASAIVNETEEKRKSSVSALKAQVESGTYEVDREKLAERVVQDELARLGRE